MATAPSKPANAAAVRQMSVTTKSIFNCNGRLRAAIPRPATQESDMRPQHELETYDEEQERMAEYSRHLEMEREECLNALRDALWDLVKPLGPPAVELARVQAKIEALAHGDDVHATVAMLDRLSEVARAFADGVSAATIAARALLTRLG